MKTILNHTSVKKAQPSSDFSYYDYFISNSLRSYLVCVPAVLCLKYVLPGLLDNTALIRGTGKLLHWVYSEMWTLVWERVALL